MAASRLLELPFEIRIKILEYLYLNVSVEIWSNHVDRRLNSNLFYTCKQLSQEARSIASKRVKLKIRTGSSLERIRKETRSYYFPHIQRLELSSTKPTPGLDLKLFPSLKRVIIPNDLFPYGRPRYTSFKLPFSPDEKSVHAILAGILDEKLKRCDKQEYAAQSNWFTQALQDPKRSFQVVVTALLSWKEPRATRRENRVYGFLTIEYDLDSTKTIRRTARRIPIGHGHHITWRNGSLETRQQSRKGGKWTWKCMSTVTYQLDESLHPRISEVGLVRIPK